MQTQINFAFFFSAAFSYFDILSDCELVLNKRQPKEIRRLLSSSI